MDTSAGWTFFDIPNPRADPVPDQQEISWRRLVDEHLLPTSPERGLVFCNHHRGRSYE